MLVHVKISFFTHCVVHPVNVMLCNLKQNVLLDSWRNIGDLLKAYYPQPSYDDMSWFALSYLRIYDVFGDDKFLSTAKVNLCNSAMLRGQYSECLSGRFRFSHGVKPQFYVCFCLQDIFDWNWQDGWDTTGECSGGLWFDETKSYKASITNSQMIVLGSKLYLYLGEEDILEKVKVL